MSHGSWSEQRLEKIIATILLSGVLLAASLVAAGGAIFLARHGGERFNLHAFHGEPADLRSVKGVVTGVTTFHGRDIIQLGLLLLIATPIARVGLAGFGFARQGDRLYVAVALIVLSLLVYSLAIGHL